MDGEEPPITHLLQAWKAGDDGALDRLIPLVYSELKRLAAGYLQRESQVQTIQPTALVHEAYLRLAAAGDPDFKNRAHFRHVAARIMRQILVDRARSRRAAKRDAGWRVELDENAALTVERASTLVALDEAIEDLEKQDAEKARILELKYFGGLTAEEIGAELGLTLNRVNWQIRTAQAWLRRAMETGTPDGASESA